MTKLLSDYCVYIEDHMPKNICNDVVNLFESADIERRATPNNTPMRLRREIYILNILE